MGEKGVAEMTVDTDPFPTMSINMVSLLGADKRKDNKKYVWVPKREGLRERTLSVFDRLGTPVGGLPWRIAWLTTPQVGGGGVERA